MESAGLRPPVAAAGRFPVAVEEEIPAELSRFLRGTPRPWIVVRGPVGSGKTTLAARLLSRLAGPQLWVRTRDSSRGSEGVTLAPRAADRPEPSRVDLSLHGLRDGGQWSRFTASLRALVRPSADDPPNGWLPPGLDRAWVEFGDGPGGGIAVDSWDGLLDLYQDAGSELGVGRETIERHLLGRLGARGCGLVLVCEPTESPGLDHAVDAVLLTAVGELEERSIRVMTIPKLRGVALEETIFPFTLDGGVFRHIPRTLVDFRGLGEGTEPDPSPEPGTVWPGSAAYAEAFGRWPVGRASLLEREEAVPAEFSLSIASAAALGTLRNGGRVVMIPPLGVSPERVEGLYERAVGAAVVERSLRIVTAPYGDSLPGVTGRIALPLEAPGHEDVPMLPFGKGVEEEGLAPISAEAFAFLDAGSEDPHPSLVVADIPAFVNAIASVGRTPSPQLLSTTLRRLVERRSVHVLGTSVVGQPILDPFRNLARPQVRLVSRRGRVFALGLRPWTPAYVVLPPAERGSGAPFSLLRVS